MILRAIRRLCGGALAVGVLAACATAPPAEMAHERRRAEAPRDYPSCIAAIAAKPEYQALWAKFQLEAGEPYPPAYLADRSYPSAGDIEALNALHADARDCRVFESATAGPAARQAIAESQVAEDKLWAEALAGRVTWGRFNARRKANAERKAAAMKRAVVAAQARPMVEASRPSAEAVRPPQPSAGAPTLNLDMTGVGNGSRWTERPVSAPNTKMGDSMKRTIRSDSLLDSSYCSNFMNTARCNTR